MRSRESCGSWMRWRKKWKSTKLSIRPSTSSRPRSRLTPFSTRFTIARNFGVAIGRQKYRGFRRFVEGIPVVLVSHGEVQYRSLKREHMTVGDLMAALREHEVSDVKKCELVMMEIDGSVSVLRQEGS